MVTLLFSAARSLSLFIRHHFAEPRVHCMTAAYLTHPALVDSEEGVYVPT